MIQPVSAEADPKSGSPARVGWILAGLILLSFLFGAYMYLSPEQRAQKLEEIKHKYEAKQQRYQRLPANPQQ